LKVFGEAYIHLQEGIWRLIKDVPLKVKGLLEGRFKTVAKSGKLEKSLGAKDKVKGLASKKDLNSSLKKSNGGV